MHARHVAITSALAVALLACPAAALAATGEASPSAGPVVVDRADFYEPGEDAGTASLLSSTQLVQISSEMKYFTKYESHGNYDLGFSPGDGYNAVGYYQFDRRWSLIPFMKYCVSYDAEKYAMFDAVIARAGEVTAQTDDGSSSPMYANGGLTELGQLVEDAWHAAYEADPEEFSLLQDNYSYSNYFVPSANYLKSAYGFSFEGRADCVSGLVWGMTNLCGASGVRDFLDWADLSNDMSDREVVNALCDAFVTHVAEKYPNQPQYHQGWINRYESERADCLALLPAYPDVTTDDWYYDAVMWAREAGLMTGYDDGSGLFGAASALSRSEMAKVLHNRAGSPSTGTTASSAFADCAEGAWYDVAVGWAAESGVFQGYGDGTFGPSDPLTREQLALVLWRLEGRPAGTGDLSAFPDASSASEGAFEALSWAVGEGIISGNDDGTLDPTGEVNRAVAATMLMRWTKGA